MSIAVLAGRLMAEKDVLQKENDTLRDTLVAQRKATLSQSALVEQYALRNAELLQEVIELRERLEAAKRWRWWPLWP